MIDLGADEGTTVRLVTETLGKVHAARREVETRGGSGPADVTPTLGAS